MLVLKQTATLLSIYPKLSDIVLNLDDASKTNAREAIQKLVTAEPDRKPVNFHLSIIVNGLTHQLLELIM